MQRVLNKKNTRQLFVVIDGLTISEVDGTIFLRAQPLTSRTPGQAGLIPDFLVRNGFGDCSIDGEAVQSAMQDFVTRSEAFVHAVARRRNARIAVTIADDAMSASLHVLTHDEDKPVTIEEVLAALALAGVQFGVDQAALQEACQAACSEPRTVAQGQPPIEGKNSDFVELVEQTANRTPKVDENGLIDYREHNAIGLVRAGDALMRRIPPVPGCDGCTVRGEPLKAMPVHDEPFASALTGSAISAHDPNLLTATMAGLPVRVPAGVVVEPVLHLEQVNLESGNIYFEGSVNVAADVHQRMKIEASGDIFVEGTVDGGRLQAGGNVLVLGGIIAGSHIQAGGSITARFVESSSLRCGTALVIQDAALDSTLESDNLVHVGSRSLERGRLVGGSVKAKMLLKVPVLGSEQANVTRVEIGIDTSLEGRFQALDEHIAKEKTNESNLRTVCQHLRSIHDPKGMLERATAAWQQTRQQWAQLLLERTALERERELLTQARIEVQVRTEGAVVLGFGVRRQPLQHHYARGMFSLNREARIVFTASDGYSYPAL